jgi:hypothetical protein
MGWNIQLVIERAFCASLNGFIILIFKQTKRPKPGVVENIPKFKMSDDLIFAFQITRDDKAISMPIKDRK